MNVPTVSDALQALNLQPSDATELEGRLVAAVAIIEGLVGPLTPQARTDRIHYAGGAILLLRSQPCLSVEDIRTIPPVGYAVQEFDPDDFLVGAEGMLIYLGADLLPLGWFEVTYTVGRAAGTIPPDLHEAVLVQTGLLWQSQRRGSVARSSLGEAQGAAITPAVRRLEQLLAPHLLAPRLIA